MKRKRTQLILLVLLAWATSTLVGQWGFGAGETGPACETGPVAGGSGLDTLITAIRAVETGGKPAKDGDSGRSIGALQISRAYWHDAIEFDPSIGGCYADCRDFAYARRIFTAYMRRYCQAALDSGDWETVARIHNGGPRGATKNATLSYWRKVQAKLNPAVSIFVVRRLHLMRPDLIGLPILLETWC